MPVALAAAAPLVGAALAGTLTLSTFLAVAANVALSLLSSLLAPKPKRASLPSQDRQISVRQAIGTRTIVYGIARTGGIQTFIHSSGSGNEYLHVVVTLTGHPVDGMLALLLDDEVVPLDDNGDATGDYAGFVKAVFGNGTTAGDADFHAALQADVPDKWTSDHRQTGCAKLYIRYKYDASVFPGNIPNPSVILRGYGTIADPRDDSEGFTDNPALVLAHYLKTARLYAGAGVDAGAIDQDALIAAANDCDEIVARKARTVNFTADAASDLITVENVLTRLRLGTQVEVSATTALPAGLSAATAYYWIPVGLKTGRLAASLANARAGTAIDLTDAGTGTLSLQAIGEPRFTCNGFIDMDETPDAVIPRLLSAMQGSLNPSGGSLVIKAGVYEAPDPGLDWDEGDLAGPVRATFYRPLSDLLNGVKGVFTNPDENFQPTDYPALQDADALAADGDVPLWGELELPFTNSPSMCQRLASIALQRNRRQVAVTWPMNMKALKARATDTVTLTRAAWGWDQKVFQIASHKFLNRGSQDAPVFGVDVEAVEYDAAIFAWDADTQEQTLAAAATTTLPNPNDIAAPTDLFLFPETVGGQLYLRAEWTAAENAFVVDYAVQHRLSPTGSPPDDPAWVSDGTSGGDTTLTIGPLTAATNYDVRVRSISNRGLTSAWLVNADYPSEGDTTGPGPFTSTGWTSGPAAGQAQITGTSPADADVASWNLYSNEFDTFGTATLVTSAAVDPSTAVSSTQFIGYSVTRYFWWVAVDVYGNEGDEGSSIAATGAPLT